MESFVPIKPTVAFDCFAALDIRVGSIISAEPLKKAQKPAYKLKIDFGDGIGIKKSSAQISRLYSPEELIDKQILAILNFPPKQIADFMSEVLVLGIYTDDGVVLISPDKKIKNGCILG